MFNKLMEYEFKKFGNDLPETVFGFISSMIFFSSILYILGNHKPMYYLIIIWVVSIFFGYLGYRFSKNFVREHK